MSAAVGLPSGIIFSNQRPFVLVGGMNVIESEELLLAVAEEFRRIVDGIPGASDEPIRPSDPPRHR